MGYKPYSGFEPKWIKTPAPADSYRSISVGVTRNISSSRRKAFTT